MICDFCGDETMKRLKVYECGRFTVEGLATFDKGWGACDPCASLIDANDHDGLIRRAMTCHEPHIKPGKWEVTLQAVSLTFTGFFLLKRVRRLDV